MSDRDEPTMDLVDRAWDALTPEQRSDAERFQEFWDTWPQGESDIDPDTWAKAEQVRTMAADVLKFDAPVRFWAEWLRASELFDATAAVSSAGGNE